MSEQTKLKDKKSKAIKVRVTEKLFSFLQKPAKELQLSVNGYINFVLNSAIQKQEVSFEEKINKYEKKEVESRVHLTISEAEVLKEYAMLNNWSIAKEIRYRIVSSLAKKPKLSKEELKAIYSVRSSINVLGANINRLIVTDQFLSNENIGVCKELIELINELKVKVNYLEVCSYSNFKLKGAGNTDGI